ncbi:MAG: hypothetical protein Q8O56_09900 [Solirubrobacteraceae bacterium]|nr:hypothetical protein [Solirubrobacteraceae bacterium]
MGAKALLALGTVVIAVIAVAAIAAFFVARDEPTVPPTDAAQPGTARPAGALPAVAPGNVLLLHGDERLTRDLRQLAERIAGAPDPALTAAGQAVLVQRRADQSAPVVAVTTTRTLTATGADDPALEAFVEHWLGRQP